MSKNIRRKEKIPIAEDQPVDLPEEIEVYGAREHNLKDISVKIPRHKLTVITGLSGSGKSSLAFDTLFAEGQRRYIETFGAYVRNFLGGGMERPKVEEIKGLGPVISIEQKTTSKNPRSTVGTVTELFDFFRLLYARAAKAYSYDTGVEMVRYSDSEVLNLILTRYEGKKIALLAPVVKERKGHYQELFSKLAKKGFHKVRVDGELRDIVYGMRLERYQIHSVEVVIDRFTAAESLRERIMQSLALALKEGEGVMMVLDYDSGTTRYYSRSLMDPETGLSYKEPAPHNFSFNSPQGWCPHCHGLGEVVRSDRSKIIPNPKLSIYKGGIAPLGKITSALSKQDELLALEALVESYGYKLTTPIEQLPEELIIEILDGSREQLEIQREGRSYKEKVSFLGVGRWLEELSRDSNISDKEQRDMEGYLSLSPCPECGGQRLNREALSYRIDGYTIADVAHWELDRLYQWAEGVEERLDERQRVIAREIFKEIRERLGFLVSVGLHYLSMDRASGTLSGGESQRIRLASQIGSQLVEVLYILDEPSIGLHQRDNIKLIESLKTLRDIGNTVLVVEHDKDMILAGDYLIDIGPRAGRHGGKVVFSGSPEEIYKADTLTAQYIRGLRQVEIPSERRLGNGKILELKGARGNNLKGIDVHFPLGCLIGVAGVSGSGKSTLINHTLYPAISKHLYHSHQEPLTYDELLGLEHINKIIAVDQSPIGRTPRSNPATFTGVFADIRNLFAGLPESKARGYKPGRFSFNVAVGRCSTCNGNGYKTIEMGFMPDVYVPCESCQGKRYNRETLEVRFKGKSISDVLDMTINQAVEFFEHVPHILNKVKMLQDVGLGYISLGQRSTTLSGGESQRVKLAAELAKRDTGKTLYLLDEPTTGLHFEDIRVLMKILDRLVDRGNTVMVIEHNLDVLKRCDYIVEIGPEGGQDGGELIFEGTPEALAAQEHSPTASFMKQELLETKCKNP